MTRTRVLFLLATGLAFLTTGGAVAAVAPTYWTPAQMAAISKQLPGPYSESKPGSGYWGTPANIGAKCVGIGTVRAGAFPGFRCQIAWRHPGPLGSTGTGTMWVRPQPRGLYCISSTSFATCPAVALQGDPRVCVLRRGSPKDRYAEYCAMEAATTATVAKLREGNPMIGISGLSCSFRNVFVHTCSHSSGTSRVTFSLVAGRWTTEVTLTPKG